MTRKTKKHINKFFHPPNPGIIPQICLCFLFVFPRLSYHSEAWGPPQFQEKRSQSEKAILGALGVFQGILGAALGVQKIIFGMRNPILGMASHDLCKCENHNSRSNSRSDSRNSRGTHMKDFHLPMLGGHEQ